MNARLLAEKQRALADAHPEEYVVVLGEELLLHTTDKREAFAAFHAAWDDALEEKPVVIPPKAIRDRFDRSRRGRGIRRVAARHSGTVGGRYADLAQQKLAALPVLVSPELRAFARRRVV